MHFVLLSATDISLELYQAHIPIHSYDFGLLGSPFVQSVVYCSILL
jgi:hypothetical protein